MLQPARVRADGAHRPGGERLLRLLASTSTPASTTSARGTSSASCGCARRRSRDPDSYFHRYAALSDDEAVATANRIWDAINGPNLVENILPTRSRATLVLPKGDNHEVRRVRLRKI